ncbi:Transcription initiation factor IIF subunit alpha [Lachnellula suecica]|uniref:Transcription initiation factor IIF subunit alpha n=1 Tax=Lachnellula suecica TaxID=602035 RepID=A0A8T9C8A1_9HELO|nr:Transcription initiation factor IIF subunit alpha [Lachnellula suecica]
MNAEGVSPSGLSNDQTPTPNGGPPQFVRKQKATDPLRPRKKSVRRPNVPAGAAVSRPNGPAPVARPVIRYPVNGILPPRGATNGTAAPHVAGGWTNTPPPGTYVDFPLFTTKRALREGLRYHVSRFSAKKTVDPTDQSEFTRPVVLHRRDPKQPPPGKGLKDEDMTTDTPMDSKEREKMEILKAEKDARKAADLAQIAPTGNNASALAAKKNQAFRNEKTTQVHRLDKTAEQKKASDLRYEEALPWHLEDADNKNTWVGNYEAALSDTNVIFVIDGPRFIMVPIEKWYKFTPKNQFKTYTIEEAEAQMNKKTKESRWVMKANEKKEGDAKAPPMHKMYTVKAESNSYKNSSKNERQDMDDLDFEQDDLFQDDDEQATVEPDNDEDAKDAQEKIKREQLGANIFDQANEAEVERELEKELRALEMQKKVGKKTRKALTKREQNLIYESDSDHPYSESSEDESDEDKQKETDKKKEEEAKNKIKTESKAPSGTSSKGTNTPSGRPKHSDPLKKPKTNLKRSGSPNLSESSGDESSRKKLKKKHHGSPDPSRTGTPIPGSRPMSPAPPGSQPAAGQGRKSSIIKLNVNSSKLSEIQNAPPNPSPVYGGSMSDGEATGGEMSDAGKKKKIKLRIGSPSGSRVGSPAPGRAGSIGAGGSRAGSPSAQEQSMQPASPSPILFLQGFFIGNTFKYGFQEKWIFPKQPVQPVQPQVASLSYTIGVYMKLAVRSCFTQWLSAPSSASFTEWLQGYMRTRQFWSLVLSCEKRHMDESKAFQGCYSLPYASPGQTHPLSSTRYLSSLHKYLLTHPSGTAPTRTQSPNLNPIAVEEIIAAIPTTGIASGALIGLFAGRVGNKPGQTDKAAFFAMVKQHSRYTGTDKLLRPK